jgi:hypothetical protein
VIRRAILGEMSETAKNYVTRGNDRVMSWANLVTQRLCVQDIFHIPYHIWNMEYIFFLALGYFLSQTSAMVSNAAAARDAIVRTWFQAVQPLR